MYLFNRIINKVSIAKIIRIIRFSEIRLGSNPGFFDDINNKSLSPSKTISSPTRCSLISTVFTSKVEDSSTVFTEVCQHVVLSRYFSKTIIIITLT